MAHFFVNDVVALNSYFGPLYDLWQMKLLHAALIKQQDRLLFYECGIRCRKLYKQQTAVARRATAPKYFCRIMLWP